MLNRERLPRPELEHRHYKVIARIIAMLPTPRRNSVAKHFATELEGTNPNYDRQRFLSTAMGDPISWRDKR